MNDHTAGIPTEPLSVTWRLSGARVPLLERHLRALAERGVGSALHAWLRSRLEWAFEHHAIEHPDGSITIGIDPQGDVTISVAPYVGPEGDPIATTIERGGHVIDGDGASVWIRIGERVATPPFPPAAPRGSRSLVIDLARTLGWEVEVRELTVEDIERADEAFFVSDVHGVVSDGRGGEFAARMQACFARLWG